MNKRNKRNKRKAGIIIGAVYIITIVITTNALAFFPQSYAESTNELNKNTFDEDHIQKISISSREYIDAFNDNVKISDNTSVEIIGVSDGLFFSAYIKTGNNEVEWSISVDGTVFLGGKGSGTLPAGVTEMVKLPLTVGFGSVTILVSANEISSEYTAVLYGPFFVLPKTTWKTGIIDGNIIVNYRIYEGTDKNGDTLLFIEDRATTIASISMEKCISLMKDVSRHKEFTGDHISKIIRNVSDNEWIIYYFTKNPWPLKDSDCVARMAFLENTTDKTAVFNFTAAPSEYEYKDIPRMRYYNVTYSFKDLGNGQVEITLSGRTSPPVKAPLWLIKSVFPELPATSLQKIIDLVQ